MLGSPVHSGTILVVGGCLSSATSGTSSAPACTSSTSTPTTPATSSYGSNFLLGVGYSRLGLVQRLCCDSGYGGRPAGLENVVSVLDEFFKGLLGQSFFGDSTADTTWQMPFPEGHYDRGAAAAVQLVLAYVVD